MSRVPISNKTRFHVFRRDGFVCQYCGKTPPEIRLRCDHIDPVANGGSNDIGNLITSCFECNSGKSDVKLFDAASMPEWRPVFEPDEDNQLEKIVFEVHRAMTPLFITARRRPLVVRAMLTIGAHALLGVMPGISLEEKLAMERASCSDMAALMACEVMKDAFEELAAIARKRPELFPPDEVGLETAK